MFRIFGTHDDGVVLLCVLERLLVGQCRVLEQEREEDQRDTKADTDDAQDLLYVLVGEVDGRSRCGACWVGDNPGVRGSVDLGGKGSVANGFQELLGQSLRPDRTGNGRTEC